ncbi:IpaD/SipD/SspD family type III secretion system needle tip protein [Symbiopectobacterium sp. RP]|uniref:IpaD/SipD/SspD family type III secretion system needle tip protein n=1 Tax=Symbiopectobacterium sp. RP TaxID=3248553 RepID=UPI003D27F114
MEILSTTRPSFRVDSYSQDQSANNLFLQEPIADEMNILPRSDGTHRTLLAPFSFIMADAGKLEGFLKNLNISGFLDEMKTIQARRELLSHDVQKRMRVLDDLFLQNPELENKAFSSDTKEPVYLTLAKRGGASYVAPVSSLSNSDVFSTLSSKKINDLISTAIGKMSESYLNVFQQAVEKHSQFYKNFSVFMSTLPQFISADGDKTILDDKGFKKNLQELMGKYPVPGLSTTLFPSQTGSTVQGARREECEAWAKEFGLSVDNCIYQLPDGTYIVHIDISPLVTINNSVENKDMSFNAAQWSAWQTSVDMQKDHIQNSMQTLTQKFANAHSTFDNLVKVLSSTIASLLECDKQFFV